jgi:hypothetical protein
LGWQHVAIIANHRNPKSNLDVALDSDRHLIIDQRLQQVIIE